MYMRPGGIKTYQDTGIIIGVIGAGLQSPLTNNFAHLRLGASSEAGGTKAEQEELQGHHPQTTWKTWKNHRKQWLAVGGKFYSNGIPMYTLFILRNSESCSSISNHVLVVATELLVLVERGCEHGDRSDHRDHSDQNNPSDVAIGTRTKLNF